MNIPQFSQLCGQICTQVGQVLLGQKEVIDHVLVAILARGHLLLEGVPGLGKTLLVRSLATVLGCHSKRIQFTPDLMPSDVTGGNIFNQRTEQFEFLPGPVFTQLLLADEINRAPAKTQSALLEAMQERSVSIDGVTRPLPHPFFVLATQNPIESQGTYPLPDAQLDRFLFKIHVSHPAKAIEKQLLTNVLQGFDAAALETAKLVPVIDSKILVDMQMFLNHIRVDEALLDYITEIISQTRSHRSIYLGASPRASIALLQSARAWAAMQSREFVIPDDIKYLAPAVLRHRLVLQPEAEFEGLSADSCIQSILQDVPVPKSVA